MARKPGRVGFTYSRARPVLYQRPDITDHFRLFIGSLPAHFFRRGLKK
ncbi:hypothetical protein Hsw_1606 [Hymenobacter swuensis DY53]|uniref:Uncharacterized protein n=1 Tax=Hymenobacter swuensis DY53 TaxID=1227739 RepID=W8F3N1_9BACT|nr:hypothetical protein Hsw_1606 [Hymenobacter swuensis DY53]